MSHTTVAIGPAMSPDEEAAHKQRLRDLYTAEAERAVEVIEAKVDGMQQSLAAARARLAELRAGGGAI